MRKSNLAWRLGAAALALLLGGSARAHGAVEPSAASAGVSTALLSPAGQRQPESAATLGQPERISQASELACFSDGVSCAHALECCSGGCVRGECGPRNRSKRRLARR